MILLPFLVAWPWPEPGVAERVVPKYQPELRVRKGGTPPRGGIPLPRTFCRSKMVICIGLERARQPREDDLYFRIFCNCETRRTSEHSVSITCQDGPFVEPLSDRNAGCRTKAEFLLTLIRDEEGRATRKPN